MLHRVQLPVRTVEQSYHCPVEIRRLFEDTSASSRRAVQSRCLEGCPGSLLTLSGYQTLT